MKILGITRDKVFSPNMENNDLEIMKAVASELIAVGHNLEIMDETSFASRYSDDNMPYCDLVFTMMRSKRALCQLERLEKTNVKSINPSIGIRNAERKCITRMMTDYNVPIPLTFYDVNENDLSRMKFPYWMKRGEGWARTCDDVVFVQNLDEAKSVFTRFKQQYPCGTVMMSEHLYGDLVKFYGVEGTDFFYWYYPVGSSKFGLEKINGEPMKVEFDDMKLKMICDKLANKSMIYVYGGDCIIKPDGAFYIIDFNDWPSFSPCREQAAKAIAHRLLQ